MRLVADEHLDLRRSVQAARFDVPADAVKQGMSGGGYAHGNAQAGSRRQAVAGAGRDAKEILHPLASDLLRGRRCWR